MLSRYARTECFATAAAALSLAAACFFFGVPVLIPLPLLAGACILLFYRDPQRLSPKDRSVAVSPADGKVSSIHEVAHFEPFGGPAVCVRVFLSVFDVHVNYCPCHALVKSIAHKPGEHISVLNPRSAEVNEAITIVFLHPTHKTPLVAVRQIAGLFARTVHCALAEGQTVQRGAKLGIMKLGSTAELYLPVSMDQVLVRQGQRVVGAITPLAVLPTHKPAPQDTPPAAEPASDDPQDAAGSESAPTPMEPVEVEAHGAGLSLAIDDEDDAAAAPAFVPTDTAVVTAILPEPEPHAEDPSAASSADLTDHAIAQVMEAHEVTDTSHALTAAADGEVLTARMENAGTDLMLHPAEHGEENETLAASLAGLRPEAHAAAEEEILPPVRQPEAEQAEDSGDWKIVPTGKKSKKPKADGLLWEDAS